MSDTLRDRIAKAIYLEHDNFGKPDWKRLSDKVKPAYLAMADAVIAELGLTRVTRSERVPIHRYVTDWKADDE